MKETLISLPYDFTISFSALTMYIDFFTLKSIMCAYSCQYILHIDNL